MDDYKKLLDGIRHCSTEAGCTGCPYEDPRDPFCDCANNVSKEAAEAIESLQKELNAYKETGLKPEEIRNALDVNDIIPEINVTVDHIRELLRAEQDGRLVVLPCKVGDHVWANGREAIVVWFFGYKTERYLHAQFLDNAEYTDIPFYEIGKTVFMAREEAEAALKGGEG